MPRESTEVPMSYPGNLRMERNTDFIVSGSLSLVGSALATIAGTMIYTPAASSFFATYMSTELVATCIGVPGAVSAFVFGSYFTYRLSQITYNWYKRNFTSNGIFSSKEFTNDFIQSEKNKVYPRGKRYAHMEPNRLFSSAEIKRYYRDSNEINSRNIAKINSICSKNKNNNLMNIVNKLSSSFVIDQLVKGKFLDEADTHRLDITSLLKMQDALRRLCDYSLSANKQAYFTNMISEIEKLISALRDRPKTRKVQPKQAKGSVKDSNKNIGMKPEQQKSRSITTQTPSLNGCYNIPISATEARLAKYL